MRKSKPIRRHSKPRRALMNTKYYGARGLRLPIKLMLGCFAIVCTLTNFSSVLCLIWWFVYLIMGQFGSMRNAATSGVFVFVFFFCSIICAYILHYYISTYTELPEGHLLNPVRPDLNEILPEAEILVRASSVSDAAQKETLLRSVVAKPDAEPETLLRASKGNLNV